MAAATGEGSERLSNLAKDELRYGLMVFEAKQWMVAMGNSANPGAITKSIKKSENLYRQILAENNDSLIRTQEAQAALYAFTENKTGNAFSLSCAGQRITVVN